MAVMIPGERQHSSVLLPGEVQEWIMDFDWGTPVRPMEFELALPGEEMVGRARKGAESGQPPVRPAASLPAETPLLPTMDLGPSNEPAEIDGDEDAREEELLAA